MEINTILPYIKDFALPLMGALIGFASSAFGQHLSYQNSQKHKKVDNIDSLLQKAYDLQYYRYLTNMWSYSAAYHAKSAEMHHHYSTLAQDDYKQSLGLANEIMSKVFIHFPELSPYVEDLHLKTVAAVQSKNKVNATKDITNEEQIVTKEMQILKDVLSNFKSALMDLRNAI